MTGQGRVLTEMEVAQAISVSTPISMATAVQQMAMTPQTGSGSVAWFAYSVMKGHLLSALEENRLLLEAGSFPCWSCKAPVSMSDRQFADGNCPHCRVELDLEEGWPV